MKLVTFARPMAPYCAGETRLVEDAVAARLEADGALSASETWPEVAPDEANSVRAPKRKAVKPERPASGLFDQRSVR
jgi:hypothetical protein